MAAERTRFGGALILAGMAVLLACGDLSAESASSDDYVSRLATLDIDGLLAQEIVTLSKKPQQVSKAAAAVFVLTHDDIRRSGATNLAEVLRLVPELHVARLDAHRWAISARGFNGRFANKLLVLIDGRSVYTPLFSGVYWETADTLLEDIERIEVIRGPGATLWGTNAVNGVINVITKHAKNTVGGLATVTSGTEYPGGGGFRYGQAVGKESFLRAYAKGFYHDDTKLASGGENTDNWHSEQGGFRFDSRINERETLTFQGDIQDGETREMVLLPRPDPTLGSFEKHSGDFNGKNLLARWSRSAGPGSETSLQFYWDQIDRKDIILGQDRDTFDLDFQNLHQPLPGHDLLWGVGYRYTSDRYEPGFVSISPAVRDYDTISGFVQDEVELLPQELSFILGTKLEQNSFDGFQVQPSARIFWNPVHDTALWGSISRAVRTSSRADQGISDDLSAIQLPNGTIALNRIIGNPDKESEKLIAYEAGFRQRITRDLSLDLTVFYNEYPRLSSAGPGAPFPEQREGELPHLVVPINLADDAQGESFGGAALMTYHALKWWQLQASYSYLNLEIWKDPESADLLGTALAAQNPEHLAKLRSLLSPIEPLEIDSSLCYVDAIPGLGIDPYLELSLRVGWTFNPGWELSLLGENLLHDQHAEYASTIITTAAAEIERSVSLRLTHKF